MKKPFVCLVILLCCMLAGSLHAQESWKNYTTEDGLPNNEIRAIAEDASGVKWFGSIVGVWRYDGETWQSFSRRESGLANDVYVRALHTDTTGKKWIGSRGALTSLKTAEAPKLRKTAVPNQTVIFNNYPNPFNPDTTIEFVIPENGSVTVDIYNVTGQKIRSLMTENLTAGKHTVVWDGRNNVGSMLSSGVYFVRLETVSGVLSHRIMLVR